MYDTDEWGSHSSRENLGVFESVSEALKSLCDYPDRLKSYFVNSARLFIEVVNVNEFEGYSQVFDSDLDDNLDMLKRVMFFESIQRFQNDLGFLDVDTENDIDFDLNSIQSYEDVSDELIEEYLDGNKKIFSFIKASFE
jgi:hypothetical protein